MNKKILLFAVMLLCTFSGWAQTNLIASWHGGDVTTAPTNFGWASSYASRTWGALNGGGARITDSYSGYKDADGNTYSYDSNDKGTRILWIRYSSTSETYTYTFEGLTPGKRYKFTGLVGWHNNSNAPTFTIKIGTADTDYATASQYISTKQKLYGVSMKFDVPEDETATDFKLKFTSNQAGDCMEALTALSITELSKADMLEELITTAEAITVPTANVGTGVFQYSSSAVETFTSALTAAKGADKTSTDDVTAKYNALYSAISNLTINEPAEGALFNVALTGDGFEWSGKPVTFKTRADQGGYNMYFSEDAGSFYGQAVTFTKKEGNTYTMSIVDETGARHYVCTGTLYKGNNNQLRMTDNASSALPLEIIPTSTEGVYNIRNTAANALIGSGNDSGFYTAQTHKDFTITAAAKHSVSKTVNEGRYTTCILPFAAAIPEGVTAYTASCEAGATSVTLTEVEGGNLEACKPYLLKGTAGTYNFSDYAVAKTPTYTEGVMTGTLALTAVPTGSYVLQTKDSKQGFYIVAENSTINSGAYKCYLTVPSAENAREAYFFDEDNDNTTTIGALNALTSGSARIYDLQGRQHKQLQKGINIVGGVKVLVK